MTSLSAEQQAQFETSLAKRPGDKAILAAETYEARLINLKSIDLGHPVERATTGEDTSGPAL